MTTMIEKEEKTPKEISSGFKDLDALTNGFQKQELIILASRPSVGKTSLALNFVEAAILPKHGEAAWTLFFGLEMGASQYKRRMQCSRARVSTRGLRNGVLSRDELRRFKKAEDELGKAPIHIEDLMHPTIMDMRARARLLAGQVKLGFIVVDYWQLISPTDPKMPREQWIDEVLRGLKGIAKELDVPVLAVSQMNREPPHDRIDEQIEQYADVALVLTHPKGANAEARTVADADMVELTVTKNRNGAVGGLKWRFFREMSRFDSCGE